MDVNLLLDVMVICGIALGVILLCHRVKIPAIVGFLLTGMLAGPHGLGVVRHLEAVEHLAEIGVVCLLFTIGLEFSVDSLKKIKRMALFGGSVQVIASVILSAGLASLFGLELSKAIFLGFMLCLSSTAIVLKILQDRAELESPHGQLSLGVLLYQDVMVVPMMLVAPLLAGTGGDIVTMSLVLLAKIAVVLALVYVAARWLVPWALYQTAKVRDREVFFLAVVFLCLGVACLTSMAGLSLALGAFLAGLIIAESDYGHRALGDVLPFRDLFTSLFFVSIGMLLNIRFVIDSAVLLSVTTVSAISIKFLTAALAALILGFPLRTAILAGFALSQIGEFAFVLSKTGLNLHLLGTEHYQLFLGVSVLSMMVTPFVIAAGDPIASRFLRLPMPQRLKIGFSATWNQPQERAGHVIIVGFGPTGRNLFQASCLAGLPSVIVEMNPETVKREKQKGVPIFYGDASQEATLEHAGIGEARALVVVVSDPGAARRTIQTARRLNPQVYIIARTRFFVDMQEFYELGADEVIPEDYEASIEILVRLLTRFLVPRDEIDQFVAEVRSKHYAMLRKQEYPTAGPPAISLHVPEVETVALRVCPGSPGAGKSLKELDLRKNYGITILAIRRGTSTIPNPSGQEQCQAGDVLIIMGSSISIASAAALFRGSEQGITCESRSGPAGCKERVSCASG